MQSKQLNFFITPEDKEAINDFLKKKHCCLLADDYINKKDNNCKSLLEIQEGIFQVYLTKDEFLKSIKTLSTENKIEYYDNMVSPIIQFDLGGFYPYDKSLLQRARFYYIKGYYKDGNYINKSAEFINWADSLIRDFKKGFLIKDKKEKAFLYSKQAIKWIESNNAILVNGGQQWKVL